MNEGGTFVFFPSQTFLFLFSKLFFLQLRNTDDFFQPPTPPEQKSPLQLLLERENESDAHALRLWGRERYSSRERTGEFVFLFPSFEAFARPQGGAARREVLEKNALSSFNRLLFFRFPAFALLWVLPFVFLCL